MKIDDQHFPVVRVRAAEPDNASDESAFTAFEALLAREQAFVLLNEGPLGHNQEARDAAQMKQTSLWMKRNKVALRTFVKASIAVDPSAPRRLASKAFTVMYEKFWGYPLLLVASWEDALALAQELLAGSPTAQPASAESAPAERPGPQRRVDDPFRERSDT